MNPIYRHDAPVRCAEAIQVIRTVALRGEGVASDPLREVTQYWSLDGELLAESDPHPTEES